MAMRLGREAEGKKERTYQYHIDDKNLILLERCSVLQIGSEEDMKLDSLRACTVINVVNRSTTVVI